MNDFISKLNNLKSIEPNENWVVEARKKVLSEAPVFAQRKSVLSGFACVRKLVATMDSRLRGNDIRLSFKKIMVPAFSLVFVLSGGVFTVGASKSSLPGEFLYSLKMINEDMTLVIASKDKKATIEMEHAGKRLEEMAEISKKTSDVEQQEKIGRLMERFEEKIESANDSLTKIDKSVEKTKIARAINTQSEKYTEVLTKTTKDLPTVVKDEILEEIIIKAIDSNEKIYLTSMAVITEEEGENEEIVEEVIDDASEEGQDDSEEDSTEDDEETKGAEDGEEDQGGVEEGSEKAVDIKIENAKKEPLDDDSDDSNGLDDSVVDSSKDSNVLEEEDEETNNL